MKLLNSVRSSLFTLSTLLLFNTTATPPAQAVTLYGCPDGYFCIYGEGVGVNAPPTFKYYRYGTYKLYNQYNNHVLFNNQTGGARVLLCKNSNGTNCPISIRSNLIILEDLTPINSIRLVK